jgi:hypothetical protein
MRRPSGALKSLAHAVSRVGGRGEWASGKNLPAATTARWGGCRHDGMGWRCNGDAGRALIQNDFTSAIQAYDEGSIPFTRSNLTFRGLGRPNVDREAQSEWPPAASVQ